MQDEDCCLKHIHDRILNLQRQRNLELAPGILYDRLFAHFFSTYRPRYLSQDIHCLLTITSDETHHVSRSVSAFYLKRTLKSNCDAMTGIAFNPQVSFNDKLNPIFMFIMSRDLRCVRKLDISLTQIYNDHLLLEKWLLMICTR